MDEFCASPKRKEYKVDNNVITRLNGTAATTAAKPSSQNGTTTTKMTSDKTGLAAPPKTRSRVSRATASSAPPGLRCIGATGAGCVLTRMLATQDRGKSPNIELVNDDTCDSFTQATTLESASSSDDGDAMTLNGCGSNKGTVTASNGLMNNNNKNKNNMMEADNDVTMENGCLMDETNQNFPFKMFGGRAASPLHNNHHGLIESLSQVNNNTNNNSNGLSSIGGIHNGMHNGGISNGNITAEGNIFLQEPVSTLIVDPPPPSPPAPAVPLMTKGKQSASSKQPSPPPHPTVMLLSTDSNSGDSGVVIDKVSQDVIMVATTLANMARVAASAASPLAAINNGRTRKPTTPHRILCPSSPPPPLTTSRSNNHNHQHNGKDHLTSAMAGTITKRK